MAFIVGHRNAPMPRHEKPLRCCQQLASSPRAAPPSKKLRMSMNDLLSPRENRDLSAQAPGRGPAEESGRMKEGVRSLGAAPRRGYARARSEVGEPGAFW